MSGAHSNRDADLPSGWKRVPLREIAEINPGLEIRIEDEEEHVNFVPMRAVEPEGAGLLRPEVRTYGEVKKGYTVFRSGDVIMAKITPCMENGKITVVPELPDSVCFGSTEFHVIRPETGVDPRWISNFLLQHEVRRAAQRSMAGGVGQMRVPGSFVDSLSIPIPPRPEVQRMFAELDELFPDLDAAVVALKNVQKKLPLYRAALLKAAAEGNLTSEWRERHPGVEPASDLLDRILVERRQQWEEVQLCNFASAGKVPPKNWKDKYHEPIAPDTANLPALPHRWCWATVDQLAASDPNAITDGPFGSNLKTSHYTADGVRVIRLQNIKDGAFADEKAYISREHFSLLEKHKIDAGDIVFAALGDSPPRCCIIPESAGTAIVKADCIRFKPHPSLLVKCLMYFLNSAPTRTRLKVLVHGVGRPRMNLAETKAIVVPLPPKDEQEAIVDTMDDQLSVVDHLASEVKVKLDKVGGVRQAVLRCAFDGLLVPQDPNDEPASELLKHIAAEREKRVWESRAAKSTRKNGFGKYGAAKVGV